ncbi:MAG: hypothetical protein EBS05_08545 [Proteobacteria bacterium]|nr:hypothetical protein [Pseudomonadota bacterium]
MNVKINLSQCLAAAAAATLLQGCVGYNRVAFATKSNVGLDFDTQPVPTMQVNISRKEMAIEPTYEGGQTPPLLASFGSNPESKRDRAVRFWGQSNLLGRRRGHRDGQAA